MDDQSFSEEDVKKKIASGEYVELRGENVNLKSTAYSKFVLLYEKNGESYTGYVRCTCCSKVLKHNVHSSGTSHLSRHSATHAVDETVRVQPKLTSFLKPKRKLNDTDGEQLLSAMAFFCARDIRPFSAVEGPGFKKVMQTCITIGSKYGNLPASEILPSRTKVAEHCQTEVNESRKILIDDINEFVRKFGVIGVTTDMWTDAYKKKNFVAVTVHRLVNGEMKTRTLQVGPFSISV
jgi:Hermes transposase DNA-binding domain